MVSELTKNFFVCVDDVCVKDGKILLLKRNVEPFKGFWHVVEGTWKKMKPSKGL